MHTERGRSTGISPPPELGHNIYMYLTYTYIYVYVCSAVTQDVSYGSRVSYNSNMFPLVSFPEKNSVCNPDRGLKKLSLRFGYVLH